MTSECLRQAWRAAPPVCNAVARPQHSKHSISSQLTVTWLAHHRSQPACFQCLELILLTGVCLHMRAGLAPSERQPHRPS